MRIGNGPLSLAGIMTVIEKVGGYPANRGEPNVDTAEDRGR